jgi:hypothetical protein
MHEETPTIAVVGGTGAEGSAIALRLGHAGCRVIIGTRDPSKGARISEDLNGILGRSAVQFADHIEAARAAEIVILTVPYPPAARRSRRFSRCSAIRFGSFPRSRMSPLTNFGTLMRTSNAMSWSAAMIRVHARRHYR